MKPRACRASVDTRLQAPSCVALTAGVGERNALAEVVVLDVYIWLDVALGAGKLEPCA